MQAARGRGQWGGVDGARVADVIALGLRKVPCQGLGRGCSFNVTSSVSCLRAPSATSLPLQSTPLTPSTTQGIKIHGFKAYWFTFYRFYDVFSTFSEGYFLIQLNRLSILLMNKTEEFILVLLNLFSFYLLNIFMMLEAS